LRPGEILDASNWEKAKGLLPPEILEHYRKGEYANPIVEWPVFHWPEDFRAASEHNLGRFAIGPQGEVVERRTGKQPPYILGFPFPEVDPNDPEAGAKIVWNYFYLSWYWGSLRAESQVNWVGAKALERRTDQDVSFFYYDGLPECDRVPNQQNFLMQQLIVVRTPADLNGTAALTWRYREPNKRDSAWTFVPALRRVRAISPANRSDGFLGSDMSQDDGPFFDGKPEDFRWKLVGEVDQLRLVDPLNLKGRSRHIWHPGGGWLAEWPAGLRMLGWEDPNWKGVAWAPISGALARRRFWVVEGIPRDQYYLFGRLELYIDKESYKGAWNRKFSWQGELLSTMQVMSYDPHKYTRPDGTPDWVQGSNMAFNCVENVKAHRATTAGQKSSAQSVFHVRARYEPGFFDVATLARFGK